MKSISRRRFVNQTLKATALTVIGSQLASTVALADSSFVALQFSQIPLPYAANALEPSIG